MQEAGNLEQITGLQVHLYGSLALTGIGHGTDKALLLGLMGETPQQIDPATVQGKLESIERNKEIVLMGKFPVVFEIKRDLLWHKDTSLPEHPNGMRFVLMRQSGETMQRIFYSIGGGFIHAEGEKTATTQPISVPFPFDTMADLLRQGEAHQICIPTMMRANEEQYGSLKELNTGLDAIWEVMRKCIDQGLQTTGELPGGLHVKRRAAVLWQQAQKPATQLPHDAMHRVSLYAMAVNEENAAGGRVVTAPTNGAAGIIPAVLRYYSEDCKPGNPVQGIRDFLLTASAIGMLCKKKCIYIGCRNWLPGRSRRCLCDGSSGANSRFGRN